jgi:hypothetical protein
MERGRLSRALRRNIDTRELEELAVRLAENRGE